jgi:hypothetical protein
MCWGEAYIVAKTFWVRAVPLCLAALLLLGGCDDEEEKKDPEVEVLVPKGVQVRIKRIDEDEMVIVAELAAFVGIVVWALFGPGAGRRWPETPRNRSRSAGRVEGS